MTDVGPVSPPTWIPGERGQKAIDPGFPSVLDPSDARIEASPRAPQSTGRRLALARWLSRPDNPLSTRVIVNRIWQFHFGRGLAGTPSDFGRSGRSSQPPRAARLAGGRLRATRLASQAASPSDRDIGGVPPVGTPAARARLPRPSGSIRKTGCCGSERVQRLDAEEIRDAMLASSGELRGEDRRPECFERSSPAHDRHTDHPQLA